MKKIKNAKALRNAIAQGQSEFYLLLNGGIFSRKTIAVCANGRFRVDNHIDGSIQKLTDEQLFTHSNIGRGMRQSAFVAE